MQKSNLRRFSAPFEVVRSRPGASIFAISAVLFAIICIGALAGAPAATGLPILRGSSTPDFHDKAVESFVDKAVRNSTLGFGATVLITLKSRTDRRDSLALIANAQGISITKTIDATLGGDIAEKAKPDGKAREKLDLVHWGSWRSHMDALKYVIDSGVETALILEDDVDWDIYIKDQLAALATGLRSNTLRAPWTPQEITSAPYGLDWDVMHLGSSKVETLPPPFDTLHTLYSDPNTDPQVSCADRGAKWWCWRHIMEMYSAPADTRVIVPSYEPLGLVALAVTQKGAQRLLYELAVRKLDTGLDWSIRDLLVAGRAQGWTVVPPLFSSWRTGGAADSDINKHLTGLRKSKGNSPGLAWSSRIAVAKAMDEAKGKKHWSTEYWSQFQPLGDAASEVGAKEEQSDEVPEVTEDGADEQGDAVDEEASATSEESQ